MTARPAREPLVEPLTVLNVALYPYVPRLIQMEHVVEAAWRARHPHVVVNFVDYDCYSADPDPRVDVFGFDCIYLSYFAESGFLAQIPARALEEASDFFPWALAACDHEGTGYAIPYLGCTYCLIYREGDDELQAASTLEDVRDVVGTPDPVDPTPEPGSGLIVDLTGGTTDACFYVQADAQLRGSYTRDPPLPTADALDRAVLERLRALRDLAGKAQASHPDNDDEQVRWFVSGLGRAIVGPTEAMTYFPAATVEDAKLKLLRFDGPRQEQPFFVDAVGINPRIGPAKTELAVELANLVASAETMSAGLARTPASANPQYAISARPSVVQELARAWPAFGDIEALISSHRGYPFRIGPGSRRWLDTTKGAICAAIFDGRQVCSAAPPAPGEAGLAVNILRTP